MHFKKLYIKNLASIEEAEIDFENGPLSEDALFLICGETGSGKTTLLDAICLALLSKNVIMIIRPILKQLRTRFPKPTIPDNFYAEIQAKLLYNLKLPDRTT